MTTARVCLNMIVRNEAHVVREALDAAAPYISTWVIVDTGSTDGTQEVIRAHMQSLGISGQLHERPWRNFGVNRSQALELAQNHADYIWVLDADDTVEGSLDFSGLDADAYELRIGSGFTYWRLQLFRNGVPWRYQGVVHEYPTCTQAVSSRRLEGAYHLVSRRLGDRSRDPDKYARDRDLLLAELRRNPDDPRSVFYLAQSYFDLDDFPNAHQWYLHRSRIPGWDEETYYALFRVAECLARMGKPIEQIADAYLQAWEFRPTRAEPLHALASQYRMRARYLLGYVHAKLATQIGVPDDALFVGRSVYQWQALDEQAVCASWIDRHDETVQLCEYLLTVPDIGEPDRQRIAANLENSRQQLAGTRGGVSEPAR